MRYASLVATALAALLALACAADAQTSPPGIVLSLTAAGAGTATSANQVNLAPAPANLRCTFNQSAHTGTPSTTFSVVALDEASGNPYTLLTSAAITADATPSPLYVGPGLPNTTNVSAGVPVPASWRVTATVGGTTPAVTGTVHCRVQ
jgi:hypothetical protein